MVVVAEPLRRQLPGAAGRRRHRQDLAAKAETQITHPAASEGRSRETGQIRVRRRGTAGPAARTAADPAARGAGRVKNVGATRPGPDQRDRVRIPPHQPQNLDRSQIPAQRATHHTRNRARPHIASAAANHHIPPTNQPPSTTRRPAKLWGSKPGLATLPERIRSSIRRESVSYDTCRLDARYLGWWFWRSLLEYPVWPGAARCTSIQLGSTRWRRERNDGLGNGGRAADRHRRGAGPAQESRAWWTLGSVPVKPPGARRVARRFDRYRAVLTGARRRPGCGGLCGPASRRW